MKAWKKRAGRRRRRKRPFFQSCKKSRTEKLLTNVVNTARTNYLPSQHSEQSSHSPTCPTPSSPAKRPPFRGVLHARRATSLQSQSRSIIIIIIIDIIFPKALCESLEALCRRRLPATTTTTTPRNRRRRRRRKTSPSSFPAEDQT